MTSSENVSSLFVPEGDAPLQLPDEYERIKVLGEGFFGTVLKCRNKDTKNIVAVKVFEYDEDMKKEMSMLSLLMDHNLDQCNIVKFFGAVPVNDHGKVLVFEMLDISIYDYMMENEFEPMLLSDIRSVIQQMATALDALKSIGVIHSDIKTDNIMLVNHRRHPLEAKLIDFGLALPREEAKGEKLSIVEFRSPEVILDLPTISEATDMWSMGCVMAFMLIGDLLFSAMDEYEALQRIGNFLSEPVDHVLDEGENTSMFFTKTSSKRWRPKTSKEYFGTHVSPSSSCRPSTDTLEDLKMFLEMTYRAHPEEQEQCFELLMAMLKFDATERITPSEVLAHQFIVKNEASTSATAQGSTSLGMSQGKETMEEMVLALTSILSVESSPHMVCPAAAMGGLQVDSYLDRETSEDFHCELPATALKDDDTTNIQPDHCSSSPTIPPSVAIMVQSATDENTLQLEDDDTTNIQPDHCSSSPTIPPSVAIMVQSATDENTLQLEDDDTTNIQPDHCSSSPTIPPSVAIMVQPATDENTLQLEDEESAESEERGVRTSVPDTDFPIFDFYFKKTKKKKNCFRRFGSWMKKTFCCCWTCPNED